jgi:hypothetical protein
MIITDSIGWIARHIAVSNGVAVGAAPQMTWEVAAALATAAAVLLALWALKRWVPGPAPDALT